jgi:hypothetical protein
MLENDVSRRSNALKGIAGNGAKTPPVFCHCREVTALH